MRISNSTAEITHVMKKGVEEVLSPRELMQLRHPDLFSDSIVSDRPILSQPTFEYHLDTLTARKEEYQFEHFCRLIAEKEICPNLRVQTGPTGGGDSKVDSETYPVATEISDRWWLGETAGGSERWAFAFSAKKTWKSKLEADVENILSADRDYKRIYFFTNQFVSDKSRAKAEDSLSKDTGIPIHIMDRSWLVERVYKNGHLQLALSALHIENIPLEQSTKLGPNDLKRQQELSELDAEISDSAKYAGASYQLIEDCIRAAKLARSLNKPRFEIEGRLALAERLSDELGIPHQRCRVAYTQAWTAHWWFEDHLSFIKFYEKVEEFALHSKEAQELQHLLNLNHLLVGLVTRGVLSKDEVSLDKRRVELISQLQSLEEDASRPNNALFSRMLKTFAHLTDLLRSNNTNEIDWVWIELRDVALKSKLYGQFPFESLSSMVHELSNMFDSYEFDQLFEAIVEIERQRLSEGEAGESYRSRGIQKLKNGKPYDAIRWLGRAEEMFVKKEYQKELILTLAAGSYAYLEGGLYWAARNKILVSVERSFSLLQEEGELPQITNRLLNHLIWIEMLLGRVPNILQSFVWSNYCSHFLKNGNDDESENVLMYMQTTFGWKILNTPFNALSSLEQLPDVFARLGLEIPRAALLFALGHEKRVNEVLFSDSPKNKLEQLKFFEKWDDEHGNINMPSALYPNGGPDTSFRSVILGAEIVIDCPNEPSSVGMAESLLGALEALLSTSNEEDLLPHVERIVIRLRKIKDQNQSPMLVWLENDPEVNAEIHMAENISFNDGESLKQFTTFLGRTSAEIAAHCFVIRSPSDWMKRIFEDERAFARATMLGNVLAIGRNLFGGDTKVRLKNWIDPDDKFYECVREEFWQASKETENKNTEKTHTTKRGEGPPPDELFNTSQRKHNERQVLSPINKPVWDVAGWSGVFYGHNESSPPLMGFLFKNMGAATKIFTEWGNRYGTADDDNQLRIAVITGISKVNPHHYSVIVGPNIDVIHKGQKAVDLFTLIFRINRMCPESSENLANFLKEFNKYQAFYLMPAKYPDVPGKAPELNFDHYLLKGHIHVRSAWEIGENDPDIAALSPDDDPLIPDGITDPPILKALKRKSIFMQK